MSSSVRAFGNSTFCLAVYNQGIYAIHNSNAFFRNAAHIPNHPILRLTGLNTTVVSVISRYLESQLQVVSYKMQSPTGRAHHIIISSKNHFFAQNLGFFDLAFKDYSEAIKLDPNSWLGYFYRGYLNFNQDLFKTMSKHKQDYVSTFS